MLDLADELRSIAAALDAAGVVYARHFRTAAQNFGQVGVQREQTDLEALGPESP